MGLQPEAQMVGLKVPGFEREGGNCWTVKG